MLKKILFLSPFFIGAVCLVIYSQLYGSADLNEVRQRVKPALVADLQQKGFEFGQPIFIRIFKASNELEVWIKKSEKFALYKTYPICYFSGELGPKTRQGDNQAPEGFYKIYKKQLNPNSRFHLAFNLGYPNEYERLHGYTGDFLMVHGNCVSIGCYAMTDKGIEEIYLLAEAALKNGQSFFQVQSFPFPLTDDNLKKYPNEKWRDFWENLQEGYNWFEKNRIPPKIAVKNKRYQFL